MREGLEDRGRELGRVRERVLVRTVGVGAWSGADTDTEGMLVLSSVVLFPLLFTRTDADGVMEMGRTWCISLPSLRARRRRSGACAAAPISTRPDLEPRGTARGLTMEGLGLLQEPLEPAPGEADLLELLDLTPPIRLWIVRELSALDE